VEIRSNLMPLQTATLLHGCHIQTLLVLIKRQPPVGKKLLIIGTSSTGEIMESMGLGKARVQGELPCCVDQHSHTPCNSAHLMLRGGAGMGTVKPVNMHALAPACSMLSRHS